MQTRAAARCRDIHDDMDLHHLSVGFEQPPKLLVRHLRAQVSNKEVFHDVSPNRYFLVSPNRYFLVSPNRYFLVSPNRYFLIVGCSRANMQGDEVERAASTTSLC